MKVQVRVQPENNPFAITWKNTILISFDSYPIRMGIDCENLGTLLVYRKDGTQVEINHEDTVKYCLMSQEEGEGIDDIIKRELYPDLKLLRLKF
jgi:hypothetical protein